MITDLITHESCDARVHCPLHTNSELHVLMKGYLTKLGSLKKEVKLNDKLQSETKAEYEKQKRATRKRLNDQCPNTLVVAEETPE